jgi:RHS repeat-associated protein
MAIQVNHKTCMQMLDRGAGMNQRVESIDLKWMLHWLIVGVIAIGIQSTSAVAAEAIRTTIYDYEPTSGLLIKEVQEPGSSGLCLVSAFGLDAYGRKTGVTLRPCNGGVAQTPGVPVEAAAPAASAASAAFAPRTTTTTYSADQRFPERVTNALNWVQETRVYDGRFGKVSSITDANNVTVGTSYDSLGRKVLETHADGTKTKWEYVYCTNAGGPLPAGGAGATCPAVSGFGGASIVPTYYVQSTPLRTDGVTVNGPYVRIYSDALDRPIRSETQGFDGSGTSLRVFEDTQYDHQGHVDRRSRPYYESESPSWVTFSYDTLGRQTATSAAVAAGVATLRTDYNGLITTKYDALNRATQEESNFAGQLFAVTDADGGRLERRYDPQGNLVQTIDAKGNVTSLENDLLGRKKFLYDPDMGVWSYDYNAAGEMIWQADAKSQVTTFEYDGLGRLFRRSEPTLVANWTFDSCTNGKGKLCEASGGNGHWRQYAYDTRGRQTSTITGLGQTYLASVDYDPPTGRVVTQTYPGGFQTRNIYTSLGYPWKVRDLRTGSDLWTATDRNAKGQPLQYSYGNGVTTTNTYYPDGRLATTQSGSGGVVQNLNHSYDLAGNLSARLDLRTGVTTSYGYDTLGRLTSEQRSGGSLSSAQSIGWKFDLIGNLVTRTEDGQTHTYNYASSGSGSRRPHAVTSVSGFVNGLVVPRYEYDANGNLISGAGRTATWTSFDTVASIAANASRLEYLYDVDHQRAQERYLLNGAIQRTTVYLNPPAGAGLFFEEESGVNGLQRKHFVSAAGEVVGVATFNGASWSMQYWHEDHLQSVSVVTDGGGNVLERMAYEPFGKRRNSNGTTDVYGTLKPSSTDRGFTEHEHMDEVGLINMNGRIYDPGLGRFLSADPTIQAPSNLQSYNRYSYAWNNPLRLVDPSGFSATCGGWDNGDCFEQVMGPNLEEGSPEGKLSFLKDVQSVALLGDETTSTGGIAGDILVVQPKPLGFTAANRDSQRSSDDKETDTNQNLLLAINNPVREGGSSSGGPQQPPPAIVGGGSAGLGGRMASPGTVPALVPSRAGPATVTQTAPPPTVRGGMGPVRKGDAGVEKSVKAAEARGETVLGREITIRTSGGRFRSDLVTRDAQGKVRPGESKCGPTACLNPNQVKRFQEFEQSGGTPVGRNAAKAGLKPGQPIDPAKVRVDYWP